jgi:hypothetical protein
VHDGKRSERLAQAGRVEHAEDVLRPELLEDDMVDREHLADVFREPSRYLPPPRLRSRKKVAAPPPEPESPLARRSKLIALIIAAALLSGSIIAAALLGDRQDANRSDGPAAKPEITGAAALGGFIIPDAARSDAAGPAATAEDRTVASAHEPVRRPEQQENRSAGTWSSDSDSVPSSTTSPTAETSPTTGTELAAETPAPVESADPVATVREFYQLVENSPLDALSLLDPVLIGNQTGDLVRVWSSMRSIEIETIEDLGDGTVRAVVLMTQPDDRRLRVTQILRLAEGPEGMIADATLVSARNT